MKVKAYVVRAVDLDGVVQYEQEFCTKDHPDAREKAKSNQRGVQQLFDDCLVVISVIWEEDDAPSGNA